MLVPLLTTAALTTITPLTHSPAFDPVTNATTRPAPGKLAANTKCKAAGRIMWWVAGPVASPAYTIRSADGADVADDPTAYMADTYIDVFVRTVVTGWQYRGLLLRAVSSDGR